MKTRFLGLAGATIAVECVSLLGFIAAAGRVPSMKAACLAVGATAAAFLVSVAAMSVSAAALARFAGIVAVADTLFVSALGFTLYPGLVKDMDLASLEHLMRVVILAGLLFLGHLAFGLTVSLARRRALS